MAVQTVGSKLQLLAVVPTSGVAATVDTQSATEVAVTFTASGGMGGAQFAASLANGQLTYKTQGA